MIKLTICKMIERDNFFNGCDINGGQDFGVIYTENFKTLCHSLNHIETCFGTPMTFDDHLIIQTNEDDDGQPIKLSESRPDGWLAYYSFYISEVTESQVDIDKIKLLRPDLKSA